MARYEKAKRLLRQRDEESARKILRQLLPDPLPKGIQENPWFLPALALRGIMSLRAGDRQQFQDWQQRVDDLRIDLQQAPPIQAVITWDLFHRGKFAEVLAAVSAFLDKHGSSLIPQTPEFFLIRSRVLEATGKQEEALEDAETAFVMSRFLGLDYNCGVAANLLAVLNKRLSRFSESLKWLARAEKHGLEEGASAVTASAVLNTGIIHYKRGNFSDSIEALRRLQATGLPEKSGQFQSLASLALGKVYLLTGKLEKARRQLQICSKFVRPRQMPREEVLLLEYLADLHLEEGQVELARALYDKARTLAEKHVCEPDLKLTLYRGIGQCLLKEGDHAAAREQLAVSLQHCRTSNDIFEEGVTWRVLGEVHLASHELQNAQEALSRAVLLLGESEAKFEQARALLCEVELTLLRMNRPDEQLPAQVLLNQAWGQATYAMDIFLRVGVDRWTESTRQLLQKIAGLKDKESSTDPGRREAGVPHSRVAYRADDPIIHASTFMRDFLQLCDMYAATEEPVLITGETGTGKELIARRLHERSGRAGKPLVTANVAAIPASIFEREFFGHVSGAFTGAVRDGSGFAGAADGGTLFLDEIGDLPLEVQPKLLRLLQEGTFQALGDPGERRTNVRLVAATNADLNGLVKAGRFRSDLYFRLKILELRLIPLRERRDDILPLLRHFLSLASGSPADTEDYFNSTSLRLLRQYQWPGNVREVERVARTAQIQLEATGRVRIEIEQEVGAPLILTDNEEYPVGPFTKDKGEKELARQAGSLGWALRIKQALAEAGGNRSEAARLLGISRSTLYRKMREFGKS